ncbi:hypothetical protein [Archangium sp.]|uniref:hypothetical protein n=1 Tax=Archangium sp. TaxID=1872627 RepID=UPI002D6F4574|nr:hypothetical protein [Archangium sp.]HYO56170.1 hypothetical protein [Archangium sp.]
MSESTGAGYELIPGVKLKELPDLGYLLVFTPERPQIHWFNTKAWLILELCRHRPASELAEAYVEAVAGSTGHEDAVREFQDGLRALLAHQVIRPVGPET